MRSKVTPALPEVVLGRALDALAGELEAAADEEILAAARELGMDPAMRGSAAFLGLKYPRPVPRLEDFFATALGEHTRHALERFGAARPLRGSRTGPSGSGRAAARRRAGRRPGP